MSKGNVRYTFWHWFGMIAAFTLLIWLSIFGYNYLESSRGPKLVVKGEYHNFTVLPYLDYYMKNKEMVFHQDTLAQMVDEDNRKMAKQIFDYTFYSFSKSYSDYLKKYKTLWIFELSNHGSEVVSDIYLELPNKGKYLLNMTGIESQFADFNHRIKIGDMMIRDNATVFVWTEESLDDYSAYHGDMTKVTTQNGVMDIIYPVRTTGIMAWNIQKDNYPLILAIAALFITIMILVIVFYNLGLKHSVSEN